MAVQADRLAVPGQRPRALADISYNSLISDAGTTSSEDERSDLRRIPSEEAQGLFDVSIGREQSRLTSPRTPAVEKAAAIDQAGGFFGDGTLGEEPEEYHEREEDNREIDAVQQVDGAHAEARSREGLNNVPEETPQQASSQRRRESAKDVEERISRPERGSRKTSVRLPSPWRAVPRQFERSDLTRQSLRDGMALGRRRASSGPDSMLGHWQKALAANLPSIPKSLTSPFSSSFDGSQDSPRDNKKRSGSFLGMSYQWPSFNSSASSSNNVSTAGQGQRGRAASDSRRLQPTPPSQLEEQDATVGALPSRPDLQRFRTRQSQLRRTASDESLTTARTLSRVSSLGDDSRFENVSDQVNSRLKAIKDSFQDSSIKLPNIPSFANLRSDFMRERGSSVSSRMRSSTTGGVAQDEKPVDPLTRQPYQSAKAAASDAKFEPSHPHFQKALSQLDGDIVILGGYRGSILRSAKPPHRQLWVPIKVGLNIRKVDLEVGIEKGSDERAKKKVIPGGMLTHIGPVDISRRLFKRLRHCENARSGKLRVHDYGYDWRLDPNYLSKQLQQYLQDLPCNQPGVPRDQRGATVIAHSLGGLIVRHAVNQRPDLFRGVIYAGVPQTCVNILGPLRNGDEVLLSSRVLTAQVNFTIRTSFALLPLSGRCFFDKNTREEYPVDFFDPQTWIDYRLSPCIARPLPPLVKQPEPAGLTSYVTSMAKALPSFSVPGRRNSVRTKPTSPDAKHVAQFGGAAEPESMNQQGGSGAAVADGNIDTNSTDAPSISTTVTLPREAALDYLTRTLASVKRFKVDLAHKPTQTYPPIGVIYGKSTPTVFGAKVDGREGIKHADAYDELAFASGDGVVLARAAMLPEGYQAVRGGTVSSERGHITLLGDLEAVGRCLNAVIKGRRRGDGVKESDG